MTRHVMLDLETWGTTPGSDLRSIGAIVFDPEKGRLQTDHKEGIGAIGHAFHIACDNPQYAWNAPQFKAHGSSKYPLTRDPETVQWWSDQSDEARASFANPVDLREALLRFGAWLHNSSGSLYDPNGIMRPEDNIRLWSHGPSFDPPILAAAYAACGLPVPWHYRAPRDTRTALELAGMDPHKGLEPFNTGTHHNALDDAICQARAVCEAYRRLRVPDDVTTHRNAWRKGIGEAKKHADSTEWDANSYWEHELNVFDRTFEALANHPQLEK